MINYSLNFPTRGRLDLLSDCLISILRTTKNLARIEVNIAVDDDDIGSMAFLAGAARVMFPNGGLNVYILKRSKEINDHYHNFLAAKSNGKYLIILNDDIEFTKQDWDVESDTLLASSPALVYGYITDHTEQLDIDNIKNFASFPLISRIGYEAMGFVFPSRFRSWSADTWLKNLYNLAGVKIVRMPILIEHKSYHTGKYPMDKTAESIKANLIPAEAIVTEEEIFILKTSQNAFKGAYAHI